MQEVVVMEGRRTWSGKSKGMSMTRDSLGPGGALKGKEGRAHRSYAIAKLCGFSLSSEKTPLVVSHAEHDKE